MSWITNILILGSYAMIAIVCAAVAYQLGIASGSVAWLIGAAVFLFCGQVHAFMGRTQERRMLENEIKNLHRAHRIVGEELEETRRRMRDMASATEAKAAQRNDQIISEVRLLETLVGRLADGESVSSEAIKEFIDGPESVPEQETIQAPATEAVSSTELNSIFDQLSEAELLNIVRGALEENRVDVYLQPIVSLPQRKLRFYESLSRLRSVDGEVVQPKEYLTIAESAGLISIIDNLLLFRCVQIVRHLVRREKDLAIFCNMSLHSLRDQSFFPQFLDFMKYNADLANHLIFEFGQSIISDCGPMEQSNMRRLARLGFRFSMDKVVDLDLNLAELQDANFKFIKVSADKLMSALPDDEDDISMLKPFVVEALEDDDESLKDGDDAIEVFNDIDEIEVVETLTEGDLEESADIDSDEDEQADDESIHLPQKTSRPNIHAADLKELLNRYGINLIVEKIENERDVIEVVELGVDFGQGYLFGEPRPVRNLEVEDAPKTKGATEADKSKVSEPLDERRRAS